MDKMWAFLKHLKEFLSLDFRSLFILAGASWIIFFIPIFIWQGLGLLGLWSNTRPWIFLIGLVATAWLILGGVYDLLKLGKNRASNWIEQQRKQKTNEKSISSASNVEKEVLARYLAEDTTTIAFDLRDGIVNGLIDKGILYRASQASNPMSVDFDVNIQSWAWDFIKSHPDVLKGINPNKTKRHHINWNDAFK